MNDSFPAILIEKIIEDLRRKENWEDLGYLNYLINRVNKNKDENAIILMKTFILQKGL